MENAGREHGVGFAFEEHLGHVFEFAGATAGHHGDAHRLADPASDDEIEAGLGAIGIDGIQDNLTGTERHGLFGPGNGVQPGVGSAATREDPPLVRPGFFGVDGDHDALAAEFFGAFADEIRAGESAGIDADFIRAGAEHGEHVGHGLDAAANGQRHETLVGGPFDDLHHGGATVGAGGDVEEDHFIGALFVVAERQCHGIADVFQFTGLGFAELDAAGDLAGMDIETGNYAFCNHGDIEAALLPQSK